MKIIDIITQVFDITDKTDKNESLKEKLFGNDDGKGPLKKLINYAIKKDQDLLSYKLNTGEDNTLLSVLMERNAHEILRLIFENDKLLSSTSSSFADEEGIKYPTEKFNKKLIASLNNGSYEALHLLVNKFPRLCHDIYNIDDQSLTREGKEILERLKKEINQSITNLTINNDHESLENFLLSIKEPECFENFLPEEKLIASLNNGSYEALSKLVVRNQNLRKYVIDLQDTSSSLTENGLKTLKKLKKVILEDLIVNNKHEDLEYFLNSIKESEYVENLLPTIIDMNNNSSSLNNTAKEILNKLTKDMLIKLIVYNNHEKLEHLLSSIKGFGLRVNDYHEQLECFENSLLPREKLIASLNNGSYEALSKLISKLDSLENKKASKDILKDWQDTLLWLLIFSSSLLNKNGQEVLQKLKEDISLKAGDAHPRSRLPEQRSSYQQMPLYHRRNIFDDGMSYGNSMNRYMFLTHDPEHDPDHVQDHEFMPGGPK